MKKLLLSLCFLMTLSAPAMSSMLDLPFGQSGWRFTSASMTDGLALTGGWDCTNHVAVAGYEKELFQVWRVQDEVAYIAGQHLFDAGHNGRGRLGAVVGVYTHTIGDTIASNAGRIGKIFPKLPGWLDKLDRYTSVEVGGGWNPTPLEQEKPWYWSVTGKIKIPVDVFFALFSTKK